MMLITTLIVVSALTIIYNTAHDPLSASVGFAILGGAVTWKLVLEFKESFIKANLIGRDLAKVDKPIIPESTGVICAAIYLLCIFLFIPFPFMEWFTGKGIISRSEEFHAPTFPHHKLGEFLSAMLSLQSMTFLGFADDVFDIKWRYKLLLPAIASIPLLMVYYVNFGVTHIVVPIPLRFIFGRIIDLGFLYYVYMGMMAIFCTNSINILAGINGVEIGQSLIIACSIAINDFLFLNGADPAMEVHLFSLYFILPFIGVSLGLIIHNWYPSSVFVGDTYCYFAGMTFAVVGILSHFSKTILLFFIPQIFNFIYSCPQLFKLIDCPRHRLPRFNPSTLKLEYSKVKVQKPLKPSAHFVLKIFVSFGLAETNEVENSIEINNFTLMNLLLLRFGPLHEKTLTILIMVLQILASCLAFIIRYRLVHFFYEG
ncbi:glycosyl transferase family 4-domain-containing protein [Glomus cerebriforme]|uniref:UDP-N-acetylglucosamine--dolichyl-phosphate N-acetylglucosaminephosphotransferase n=1 Tax=Glomus cerebriforme TaxID=658196 RepID=A0A397TC81_9GLOM|nr:glycosyl transferase family 4-domain-containing protein [Glomus cerebriforme]